MNLSDFSWQQIPGDDPKSQNSLIEFVMLKLDQKEVIDEYDLFFWNIDDSASFMESLRCRATFQIEETTSLKTDENGIACDNIKAWKKTI
jgi:hypothetical protein